MFHKIHLVDPHTSFVFYSFTPHIMTGVIKTLKAGFGFITPDAKGPDVFFHAKQLKGVMFDDLRVGDRLSYDTQDSDRGINAVNVELERGDAAQNDEQMA